MLDRFRKHICQEQSLVEEIVQGDKLTGLMKISHMRRISKTIYKQHLGVNYQTILASILNQTVALTFIKHLISKSRLRLSEPKRTLLNLKYLQPETVNIDGNQAW